MKIGIIGAGYVGLLTATVLAHKNPNKTFVVIDTNSEKIKNLKERNHYIKEPGFKEIFNNLSNMILSSNYNDLIDCEIIFIAVCTPDQNGKCNLTYFNDSIDKIRTIINRSKDSEKNLNENSLRDLKNDSSKRISLIVKSTVPVGTTKSLSIEGCDIFNIPEFLAEGTAINDLLNPIRILIGTNLKEYELDSNEYEIKSKSLENIIDLFNYVEPEKIVITDSNTSELIKLTSNFMLASRIAQINVIENIARQYNANINDISKILRMDDRIGHKFLSPSAAFGGSCFRKDINNLSNICEDRIFSDYIKSINHINDYHAILICDKIKKNSKILFLGYGFKNGTEDTRESPTQLIINYLSKTIQYDIYDSHIEKFNIKPKELNYDYYILMNDEKEYIEMIKNINKQKIINPRYSIF